jgi:hypothetical protein
VTQDEFEGIDIGQELRDARPRPSEEFVSRLVARVGAEERPSRRVVSRPVIAFAATAAAVVVAGAFGGISEAAFTVEGAVSSIVHIGQKARPHHPAAAVKAGQSAGSSQSQGVSQSHGQAGLITPPGGPPPSVQPPTIPSLNQYNPGCFPGFRGPYISCRIFR